MSAVINEYRATEEAIKELQERLNSLAQSQAFQKELEFSEKLRALMDAYGKSPSEVITFLDPRSTQSSKVTKSSAMRRTRKTNQYKNPHTGQVIETKGSNHKILKEWKATWGGPVVDAWRTVLN